MHRISTIILGPSIFLNKQTTITSREEENYFCWFTPEEEPTAYNPPKLPIFFMPIKIYNLKMNKFQQSSQAW